MTYLYRYRKDRDDVMVPQITLGSWFNLLATIPICCITIFTVYIETLGMSNMHEISMWWKGSLSTLLVLGVYNVLHTALANPGISHRIF